MDILLLGRYSYLCEALIRKIYKEGHQIFVISGSSYRVEKYPKVFEQYDFPYNSTSMIDIMESIAPDVIVFMGAFDDGFDWKKGQPESVRFSAGLYNVLLAASSLAKKPRVVFLSSYEVFAHPQEQDIAEDVPVTAEGVRAMAFAQGEETCETFRSLRGMDIVTLRLDHLYGVPLENEESAGIVLQLCKDAQENGVLKPNANYEFSMLNVSDAVQYIYRIMSCGHTSYTLYHLSSGEVISEMRLAQIVAESLQKNGLPAEIREQSFGTSHRIVLSNRRFMEEFGERVFAGNENGTAKTADSILENVQLHIYGRKASRVQGQQVRGVSAVLKALVPFLENFGVFVLTFFLNQLVVRSQFSNVVNVYMIYVLIFAVVFGQGQAIFSAFLSMLGYFVTQAGGDGFFDVMLNYSNYLWLVQLFILGLVVGNLRDTLHSQRVEAKEEIDYLAIQMNNVEYINSANVRIKNLLHEQVINQKDSLGTIYGITSQLSQYEPENVLFRAAEVIRDIMHTQDVAIYKLANPYYARLFSSTSQTARSLGNSVKIETLGPLTENINKHIVFINRALTPGLPLMAEGVWDGDSLELILMVWGISWDHMNMSEANMLRIVGYLIQNEVLRANRFMAVLENERFTDEAGVRVLKADAFRRILNAYIDASNRGLTECRVLQVMSYSGTLQENIMPLQKSVRQSDYIGFLEDGNIYLLLANTDSKGASFVKDRLEKQGFVITIREEMTA